MTDLDLLCLEMPEADRWTEPGAFRPLAIIALDRTPKAVADEATRTLDRRLDRWSAFTDAFAPWLDTHPAPQTPIALVAFLAQRPDAPPASQDASTHGHLALEVWEKAYLSLPLVSLGDLL